MVEQMGTMTQSDDRAADRAPRGRLDPACADRDRRMADMCKDRVVVVTGAGRGIGREYALMLAGEGAKVVVNDVGGSRDGTGHDGGPAHDVVAEIEGFGGTGGRQRRRHLELGRRPGTSSSRRSTPTAASTPSSTTPASCATACS